MDFRLLGKEAWALTKLTTKRSLGTMYTKRAEGFLAGFNWKAIGNQAAYTAGGALFGGLSSASTGGSFKKGALVGATAGMGAGVISNYGWRRYTQNAIVRGNRAFNAGASITRAGLREYTNFVGSNIVQAAEENMRPLGWGTEIAGGALMGGWNAHRSKKSVLKGALFGGAVGGAGAYGSSFGVRAIGQGMIR